MGSLFSQDRVAQPNEDVVGLSFNLPKEVIQKREKVWNSLFDTYTKQMPNDVELNINTMLPVNDKEEEDNEEEDEKGKKAEESREDSTEGEQEEDDDDNDDDKDETEQKEYFSKCCTRIRKSPSLIQYWVDTGNPPYQLYSQGENSETGSSLSEGNYSKVCGTPVIQESIGQPGLDENSPCSSVDTAAYVLSNANVTDKKKTMGIVESAKKLEEFSDNPAERDKSFSTLFKNEKFLSLRKNGISVQIDRYENSNEPAENNNLSDAERARILGDSMKKVVEKLEVSPNKSLNNSKTSHYSSLTLSEVIPALQQFDDLPENSNVAEKPRSTLLQVRKAKSKIAAENNITGKETIESMSQSSCDSQENLDKISACAEKLMGRRRKLYTGRNSPIDLVFTTSKFSKDKVTQSSHPALMTTNEAKMKPSRIRVKRKRRMLQQSSAIVKQIPVDTFELVEDLKNNNNHKKLNGGGKKCHGRYIHFFESLGLTPHKSDTEQDKSDKDVPGTKLLPREQESEEKSLNGLAKEAQNSSQKITQNSSMPNTLKIPENKILKVDLEKLSEETLLSYKIKKVPSKLNSFSKLKKENIELLTPTMHDSDSTIMICNCDLKPSDRNLDSDSSNSQLTRLENYKNLEIGRKLVVKLERLRESAGFKKPNIDSVKNEKKIQLARSDKKSNKIFGQSENSRANERAVTVDTRGVEKSFQMDVPRKSFPLKRNRLFEKIHREEKEVSPENLDNPGKARFKKPERKSEDSVENKNHCSIHQEEEEVSPENLDNTGRTRFEKQERKSEDSIENKNHSTEEKMEIENMTIPVTHSYNLRVVSSDEEEEEDAISKVSQLSKGDKATSETKGAKKKSRKEMIEELMRDLTRTDEPKFIEQFAELRNIDKRMRKKRKKRKSPGSYLGSLKSPKITISGEKRGNSSAESNYSPYQRRKRAFRLTSNVRSKILTEDSDSSDVSKMAEKSGEKRGKSSAESNSSQYQRRKRVFRLTSTVRSRIFAEDSDSSETSKMAEKSGKEEKSFNTRRITPTPDKKRIVEKLDKNSASLDGFSKSCEPMEDLHESLDKILPIERDESIGRSRIVSPRNDEKDETRAKKTQRKRRIRLTNVHGTPVDYETDESERTKIFEKETTVAIEKRTRKDSLSKKSFRDAEDFFSIATNDSIDDFDRLFDETPPTFKRNTDMEKNLKNLRKSSSTFRARLDDR